tara:strand:+ start:2292 stop:3389 length:1098 start_codon:yes stop_codon:yes gene_type:complete
MRNHFLSKYLTVILKIYILIFLTVSIFLFIPFTKSLGEENVFTIHNVKVKGPINVNFSREKYLDRAFLNSFEMLMSKILLTRDLKKVKNIKLKKIKNLITSFQILEESYREDIYRANIKILYSQERIKKFLSKRNISFSIPENISAVFFPVFYINNEIQNFDENFFYTQWLKIEINNELINFILPLEDLEDISKITQMKNNIEDLDINTLVNKYDIKNYVFALMDYVGTELNIYLKTNFNNNETSKNISYEIKNIEDELKLNLILKDLKLEITDLWKEQNIINLLMPLSINLKFQHSKLEDLDKLRSVLYKISIIENYKLEEFNINNSIFKIYYYGNPKKLRTELSKFGYLLMNNQGVWHLISNE